MQAIATKQQALLTGEVFARLPNTDWCELVQGRIVQMAPPGFDHCEAEGKGYRHIDDFVCAHDLGRVAVGEVGIYVARNPDSVRAADVAFISHERYARRDRSLVYLDVAPDLVVEVLSPSNVMAEMLEKLGDYFAIGVRLVWLVDIKQRRVHAYRSLTDVRVFEAHEVVPGDDVLPGFALPVARFFE